MERGQRQSEVAELIGAHRNSVWEWEQNVKVPDARYVPRIHDYLGYCPWHPATFPERLLMARRAMGLGQRELAALLGTNQQTIRTWEKGQYRPSERYRERIRKVVGVVV